ncbi:MAG TPA: L,D-transpeptidase [Thermoleophilaceae bacterium]|jgi:lipoprotein-anchoring transpeptidase ErfK/SrfK
MPRPSLAQIVVVLLLAMLGLMAVSAAYRARSQRSAATAAAPAPSVEPAVAVPDAPPLKAEVSAPPAPRPAPKPAPPKPQPRFSIVHIQPGRTLALHSKPGGGVIAHVSSTTQFGSHTTLAVAARRGPWVGLTSTDIPNGTLGWVKTSRGDGLKASTTHMSLRIDLSRRSLELRDGRKVVRRASVGIGRPGSPTPTGRFSVTDEIPGSRYGSFYGCCIVALSGHQLHTPAGWQGGNRLAIHGTDNPGSIGVPSSAGCLHADADDLRVLMRRVPLGTPVFIHA